MDLILNEIKFQESDVKIPINPFFKRTPVTLFDKLKIFIMSITILPIRLVTMSITFMLTCFFASLAVSFLSKEKLHTKPFTKWRKFFKYLSARICMRAFFFCAGFHWITNKGKRATIEEAPIFVGAPHSTLIDMIILTHLGMMMNNLKMSILTLQLLIGGPSALAKYEISKYPILGSLFNETQPLYVNRQNSESRNNAQKLIQERVKQLDLPQLFIFPEAACSNKKGLLKFKLGAFRAEVPIQPVLLRYSNKKDTYSWAFVGESLLKSFWRSLTNLNNPLVIEFLPVYKPTEDEMEKPEIFAENVRSKMADVLGIPTTNYKYTEGWIFFKIYNSYLFPCLAQVYKLKYPTGLENDDLKIEMEYLKESYANEQTDWKLLNKSEMAKILQIENFKMKEFTNFFRILYKGKDADYKIDLRLYIFCSLILHPKIPLDQISSILLCIFSDWKETIGMEDFVYMMGLLFQENEQMAKKTFTSEEKENPELLNSDEFQRVMLARLEFSKLISFDVKGKIKEYPPATNNPYALKKKQ